MRGGLLALFLAPPAQADSLDRLVAAYPDMLSAHEGNVLVFRNGGRLDAGADDRDAPDEAVLRHASVRDLFREAYPAGAPIAPPESDPGRFRNKDFFDRLYGDCYRGEVEGRLVRLSWLPASWGHTIVFNGANGAADALKAVSAELERLPPDIRRAAFPIAGTYACRGVADLGQPSMHAWGAAIDLNLRWSNYWLWERAGAAHYLNRMPDAVVAAFERHGFVWGGRWHHFDTMHFEYRPELVAPAL
jgi:hypothetical protein